MQKIFTPLFLLFSLSIAAQDFMLTVNNGTGSGSYFYGDSVHIFSDKAPVTGVFTKWTGTGAGYLDIDDEWHTTLVVPAQSGVENLTVEAQYGQLPAVASQTTEMISLFGIDDGVFSEDVLKEVHFSIPENPKGIVFLFHGTGGEGSSMFDKYELFTLVKDLYYAGYGSIATDANERTMGDQNGDGKIRWLAAQAIQQEPDNNIDLYNIRALRDTFIARYMLPDNFPFFSFGVSNGANFSDLAAATLGFRASAHNTAHGSPSLYSLRDDATPVIWLQNINDHNASANPTVAYANYQALLDRDICSDWLWLQKSPIYEKRFMRSRNNISQQKSLEIYERFFDYPGLVDEHNFLTIDDLETEMPTGFFDPLGLTPAQEKDVTGQLKVINADHTGHGDFNKTIIRFFENICEVTGVAPSPVLQNNISVYPNPTDGLVYLKGDNARLRSVEIFDPQGQSILEKKVFDRTGEYSVDMGALPSGIYFLKMIYADGIRGVKVVVE
ncbi:MAG TPA: T9SS type A sorting domain-containing protein [Bacteroidetes bacterium]|nr:T9SS type A sorting domain-containing protein [Bacteroidota bacterium]